MLSSAREQYVRAFRAEVCIHGPHTADWGLRQPGTVPTLRPAAT